MKKIVLAIMLLVMAVPMTSAQTVIKYRRPMRALSVEVGGGMSRVFNDNNSFGGLQFSPVSIKPAVGVTFEGPMTNALDMALKVRYKNKSFIGIAPSTNPSLYPSHNIHSIVMDLGFNWFPFHQFFYMGASFQFGGDIVINRVEPDGSKVLVKSNSLNALGFTLGFALEAGFSLSFWPIGDHLALYARYENDIFGPPFDKNYREKYGFSKDMRIGVLSAGVRIPIILFRD